MDNSAIYHHMKNLITAIPFNPLTLIYEMHTHLVPVWMIKCIKRIRYILGYPFLIMRSLCLTMVG